MVGKTIETLVEKHQKALFLLCLCIAGIRVFIFNAAFPVFNNIDEHAHFDVVLRYARDDWPKERFEPFRDESARLILSHGTLEYLNAPENIPEVALTAPFWSWPEEDLWLALQSDLDHLRSRHNHEAHSPPFYYLVAGAWYRTGEILGLEGGSLIYWVRFLNVPIFALLICCYFSLSSRFFPSNKLLVYGGGILLASFPQDIFYSINCDGLSALLAGSCLYGFLVISKLKILHACMLGIMFGFALLTKLSNWVLIPVFGVVSILSLLHLNDKTVRRAQLLKIVLLIVLAIIPVCIWVGRNFLLGHDLMGISDKIQHQGWKLMPFWERFQHPLFSIQGIKTFLSDLTKTFWRGELVWNQKSLDHPGLDFFYVVSTILCLAMAFWKHLLPFRLNSWDVSRVFMLTIALFVLFLAWVSIRFDFGTSWYPSREYPYFTSGRLIAGAIVPFVILWVEGFDWLHQKLKLRVSPLMTLCLLCLGIALAETWNSRFVFSSPYNWFHLP